MKKHNHFELLAKTLKREVNQFQVFINPKTCELNNISHDGYIKLETEGKQLIVRYVSDEKAGVNEVLLDSRTHAYTLYASNNQKVKCSVVTNLKTTEKIKVQIMGNGRYVEYPKITGPIYVEPGYRLSCTEGYCTVKQGTGIYHYNEKAVLKDLLSKNAYSNGSSEMVFDDEITDALNVDSINIDFQEMGIGGLNDQMGMLIRNVLISRIIPSSMREKYAVKDIKGILLYGPPGTGKTLIAKNIAKIIPKSEIIKINGPELSSRWHGETESNIRKIFDPAKANPKKLHVIIFDEIDAIGAKRGQSSGHIDDKVLTQLLTMIDGLDSANNVLIIGITNRKDILDPALIRSGRLEFHIEIPLPNENGRAEILDIYLNPLRSKSLTEEINTTLWSKKLDGYSGADIESLIGRAKNLALLRNCEIEKNTIKTKSEKSTNDSKLTDNDIHEANKDFVPTFSRYDDTVQRFINNYPDFDKKSLLFHKSAIEKSLVTSMKAPFVVKIPEKNQSVTIDSRILASHLAFSLNVPYIRYISYNEFLGKTSAENCSLLNSIYHQCLQSEKAVLVLDSLLDVGDRALILREQYILENPLPLNKQLVIIQIKSTSLSSYF